MWKIWSNFVENWYSTIIHEKAHVLGSECDISHTYWNTLQLSKKPLKHRFIAKTSYFTLFEPWIWRNKCTAIAHIQYNAAKILILNEGISHSNIPNAILWDRFVKYCYETDVTHVLWNGCIACVNWSVILLFFMMKARSELKTFASSGILVISRRVSQNLAKSRAISQNLSKSREISPNLL